MMRRFLLLASLAIPVFPVESTPQQLPDPLSLSYALNLASTPSDYQLLQAQAAIESAQYRLQTQQAETGLQAQLELEAAYVGPSDIAFDQTSNDSLAILRINKSLYDFSGSTQRIEAASIEHKAVQQNMQSVIAHRQLEIARQFFAVILADLKYAWDNEAMAIAFVRFDAKKDRYALAQISELDFLDAENSYLNSLYQRTQSESAQRHSRALLAEMLNTPEQLPSNLRHPELTFPQQVLPDFSDLLQRLHEQNPQIRLAQQQLVAAQQRLSAEHRQFYPSLDGELTVMEHAREKGSSDDWRAQINMVFPLYENNSMKARAAQARAELLSQQAMFQETKSKVRQQALAQWQAINVLTQRRQQLKTTQALRELRLDKSRALYEMEVSTDFGEALVAISEMQYQIAKNEFELMLAWMQLRMLMGEPDLLKAEL